MIFNDEMLKANPIWARNKMGISAVTAPEYFIESSRQNSQKSNRDNKFVTQKIGLSLFAFYSIVYLETPWKLTEKLLELIRDFSKRDDTKYICNIYIYVIYVHKFFFH